MFKSETFFFLAFSRKKYNLEKKNCFTLSLIPKESDLYFLKHTEQLFS